MRKKYTKCIRKKVTKRNTAWETNILEGVASCDMRPKMTLTPRDIYAFQPVRVDDVYLDRTMEQLIANDIF